MNPMKDDWYYKNPNYILDHYKSQTETIFIGFANIIRVIEENCDYEIDHEKLADTIFNTII